ncbi:MAG: hypothetical protein KC502_13760 [Myxococcales bacterium]|nr:hypothetical protein [Myxococcales bacterium]
MSTRLPRQPCHPSRKSCRPLALMVGLCLLLASPVGMASTTGAKSPVGGCPMPANTLMINEFQVGIGAHARWVELFNPGKSAVSLKDVVIRVAAKGIAGAAGDTLEFPLDSKVSEVPGGEVLLLGHLPDTGSGGPYFGLKLIELSAVFVLPTCNAKLELLGPAGIIDSHVFNNCKTSKPTEAEWQVVLSLDPSHTDLCISDKPENWCMTTAKGAPAKPSPGKVNQPCDLDGDGYTAATGDCNDDDKDINPIAKESCNGVDDDCNSQTDDGVVAPQGTCLSDGVCAGPLPDGSPVAQCDGVNGYVCSYPSGYESVNETLCDSFDNDCDGQTDEDLLNACNTCGADPKELCNGKDDDCDGETDEEPDLSEVVCGGLGVCVAAVPICGPKGSDCQLPQAYEATETLCDGADNDCDGQTDEELGLGQNCTVGRGQCSASGVLKCAPDGTTRCEASVGEPTAEVCGDNLDNDCNGETDEGFDVGQQCTVGLGICAVTGKMVCQSAGGTRSLCDASPAEPAPVERCGNQLDDDCDGLTDEAGCKDDEPDGWSCSAQSPLQDVPNAPVSGGAAVMLIAVLFLALRRRNARVYRG